MLANAFRGEGFGQGGVAEVEAVGKETGGDGANAGQDGFIDQFAEGEACGPGGDGQDGGPMERVGESLGEDGAGDWIGRDTVDGAGEGAGGEEVVDDAGEVVEGEPGDIGRGRRRRRRRGRNGRGEAWR